MCLRRGTVAGGVGSNEFGFVLRVSELSTITDQSEVA